MTFISPRWTTAAYLMLPLLAACDVHTHADTVETLAADPSRLQTLRAQCRADRATVGDARCRRVAQASAQRFFSGQAGPDEYPTLADLPPIPASFDDPVPSDSVEEPAP